VLSRAGGQSRKKNARSKRMYGVSIDFGAQNLKQGDRASSHNEGPGAQTKHPPRRRRGKNEPLGSPEA